MRTCRLVTLGCKVNQYETQLVKEALLRSGFREAEAAEPADLCVVNTCTVTENADSRGRQVVRQLARENPNCQTIVTGCYATHDPDSVARLPNVIEVVHDKRELPDVLLRLGVADFPSGISRFDGHKRAFVKIQDGCILRCSYCIIPHVRPRLESRSAEDIAAEIRRLIDFGYEEIVLTGIHVGHYGVDTTRGRSGQAPFRLWHLLRQLDRIPGRWRLRLSSIEAAEFSDEFISAAADCEHLCPHFHPALQSGSDTVLARMRRRYRVAQFLETVAKLQSRLSNPALSTDVIVGFPGETDDEFAQTLDTCRRARFMKIHVFPFSRRRGTPAATMPNQVSAPVKKARCQELARLETELTRQYESSLIGSNVEVLVEGLSATRPGFVQGTDRRYVTVELPGNLRDFGHLVAGIAQPSDRNDLVANRLSAPHQASVFASDCLESHPTWRAEMDRPVSESPAGEAAAKPLVTNSNFEVRFMPQPDQSTTYITLQKHGDVLVVSFTMRLLNDEENIEQLGQELFALVEQSNWLKLVLDLSNVEYLTSSVLGKLITLHRKLHRSQGKMVLFGLSDGVDSILRTSKLLTYFSVADNRDAAIAFASA